MPLSEEEQRILHEIERQLLEQDPAFARQVSSVVAGRHAARNCKVAAVTFVAGLVLMLATFAVSVVWGAAGFAVMFASAVAFERNLRRLGRAGLAPVSGRGPWRALDEARRRMRERFRRDRG